jgi:hypothetical protein
MARRAKLRLLAQFCCAFAFGLIIFPSRSSSSTAFDVMIYALILILVAVVLVCGIAMRRDEAAD